MTTLNGYQYQGVDELLERIEQVRARRWMVRLITSLAGVTAIVTGSLLLASLSGYWAGQLPAPLRWGMFFLLIGIWGAVVVALGLRILLWRQNHAQTARFIEQVIPRVRNDLINTVLLCNDPDQVSPALVQCAINESLARTDQVNMIRSVSLLRLKQWTAAGVLCLLGLVSFAAFQGEPFRRGLMAVLQPSRYVPPVNDIELVRLVPGDTRLFAGEPLVIGVEVRSDLPRDLEAEVVIEGEKFPRPMFAVRPDGGEENVRKFQLRLDAVHQPLRYFLRVVGRKARSRWPVDRPWFRVHLKNIKIETFQVRYQYPIYTALKDQTRPLHPDNASIEAPMGSHANIRIGFADPVPSGFVEFRDGKRISMTNWGKNTDFETRFAIQADGAFRLIFANQEGKVLHQLPNGHEEGGNNRFGSVGPNLDDGFYRIRAIPDRPPNIALLAPNRNLTLSGEAVVELKIKASDEYGLSRVELWTGKENQEPQQVKGFTPPNLADTKEILVSYRWKLSGYREDDVVVYYALAADNRKLRSLGGPQTATTPKFRITIRNNAKVLQDKANRFDQLQKKLLAILQQQTILRVRTEIARRQYPKLPRVQAAGKEIYEGQKVILTALDGLVKNFPFDEETEDIRKAGALLVENEVRLAVDQAQTVSVLPRLDQREKVCGPLGETQDAIIDVLPEMLSILPVLAKKLREAQTPEGSDLTPDQRREKRYKFAEDLKKFIEEQKKIIEATRRLNKKNLDDFTPEDEKLLKELAALEDKWEKFLNESFTDFSKLGQQDFATPSMLKELLTVKTDVTMAKDALLKKATEIATALEDNAVENAETLTANLEKWLPDEPDRIKWAMEAPEEQENFEQAELFTELEDLVGDLLEEEEDLFEEMDDLSSKAMMSGDKGIGWDAMDGPISSMNAQGVTGNQLPNTSEISGRSGEGRTGKSSGEFVEDKAVGKGGRRTPTRMGDEPFQKGQVHDVSTDPPGGATGGGKLSGSGQEGLEGHTPAEIPGQMKRLAGKQASIINRAERIAANFKTGEYTSFRMKQAITLMNRVKNDLDDGRYRNALRARKVTIQALRQTQMMIGKKLEVTEDSSNAMPKYVRDNIAAARGGKLPAEYREMLEQYYRRLSERVGK